MESVDTQLSYCESYFQYIRRKSSEVKVGNLIMGGSYPIRIQSMTTTNTLDTKASFEQSKRIIEKGGELVRLTTQGRREARNLREIKQLLRDNGYNTPLVADIHFNPNAAQIAAQIVEKVRINPGNFADGSKKFRTVSTDEITWNNGIKIVKEKFIPFLEVCKRNNTAIRIGANHGSLSDRIMSKYGDTPEGMVESCLEYLRICKEQNFSDVILSIKASNTRIMVHTVRLLVARMYQENMKFPLHLGVTEAGEGEDGRIKSAVGIGALLIDGIGDTIRVSLTEEPENEIGVARFMVDYILQFKDEDLVSGRSFTGFNPYDYKRRETISIKNIGGDYSPIVIYKTGEENYLNEKGIKPDYILCDTSLQVQHYSPNNRVICPLTLYNNIKEKTNCFPLYTAKEYLSDYRISDKLNFLQLSHNQIDSEIIRKLEESPSTAVIIKSNRSTSVYEHRSFIWELQNNGLQNPVIISKSYSEIDLEKFQLKASIDTGILFLDGMADGLFIINENIQNEALILTQFNILQASRVRFSKTDYISCPGCGRTLFALQDVTAQVKQRTSHLKNLKIGIMGCIVNGIGEMADADYGYVGSGPGKVSLFKQKELIKKNIPADEAIEELIKLIKDHGDWSDT